ncbi:hypothetical protein Vretifemale_5776 [Volvox reticuliferus]|uniref:Uncharacterized protein n=1 Tax=Volvox reticuliferus TaxID=1737510 RepID=A0A8J4FH32_9CHLO|nr:hypothetical protein Vretifemale_5776 [Volvox reticuliferus]
MPPVPVVTAIMPIVILAWIGAAPLLAAPWVPVLPPPPPPPPPLATSPTQREGLLSCTGAAGRQGDDVMTRTVSKLMALRTLARKQQRKQCKPLVRSSEASWNLTVTIGAQAAAAPSAAAMGAASATGACGRIVMIAPSSSWMATAAAVPSAMMSMEDMVSAMMLSFYGALVPVV